MPLEIELKYRLADPSALRERLAAADAVGEGKWLERSIIFDLPTRRLLQSDSALRLRECVWINPPGSVDCLMAFKGPRADAGPLKGREEIEFSVGDLRQAAALLGRLEYRQMVYYERRRESWRLDECEISIDELPGGTHFVEIEGESESAILAVAGKLSLGINDREAITYVEYAATHGEVGEHNTRSLKFTD